MNGFPNSGLGNPRREEARYDSPAWFSKWFSFSEAWPTQPHPRSFSHLPGAVQTSDEVMEAVVSNVCFVKFAGGVKVRTLPPTLKTRAAQNSMREAIPPPGLEPGSLG